jgi:hypothetical protein
MMVMLPLPVLPSLLVLPVLLLQQPGLFTDTAGRFDAGQTAKLLGLIGLVWGILTAALTPAIQKWNRRKRLEALDEWGSDVMKGLKDPAVLPAFREYVIKDVFPDRIQKVDSGIEAAMKALAAAERNTARIQTIEQIAEAVKDMPRLAESLDRLDKTLAGVQGTLQHTQIVVARVEERVKVVRRAQASHYEGRERRHQQGRRRDDPIIVEVDGDEEDPHG